MAFRFGLYWMHAGLRRELMKRRKMTEKGKGRRGVGVGRREKDTKEQREGKEEETEKKRSWLCLQEEDLESL